MQRTISTHIERYLFLPLKKCALPKGTDWVAQAQGQSLIGPRRPARPRLLSGQTLAKTRRDGMCLKLEKDAPFLAKEGREGEKRETTSSLLISFVRAQTRLLQRKRPIATKGRTNDESIRFSCYALLTHDISASISCGFQIIMIVIDFNHHHHHSFATTLRIQ